MPEKGQTRITSEGPFSVKVFLVLHFLSSSMKSAFVCIQGPQGFLSGLGILSRGRS